MTVNKKWLSLFLVFSLLLTLSMGCRKKTQEPVAETPTIEEKQEPEAKEETEVEKEEKVEEKKEEAPVGIYPGSLAIPFQLKNYKGEAIALSQYKGKPVIITFWVTWSEKAMEQITILNQLKQQFEKDVAIVAIHSSDFDVLSYQETVSFLKERSDAIEMLIDEGSVVNAAYYISDYPTTFFIDEEGRVAKSVTSVISKEKMIEEINSFKK